MCFRMWSAVLITSVSMTAWGQEPTPYQQPPEQVLRVLDTPAPPAMSLSPTRDRIVWLDRQRYPSIEELSRPMVALAGIRLDPENRGPHRPPRHLGLQLQSIDGGDPVPVSLPADSQPGSPVWAPDGSRFAFAMWQPNRTELWVVDAKTGQADRVDGVILNAVLASPIQWMPDSHTLLVLTVPTEQGDAPVAPPAPVGPSIQESFGEPAPVRTYQDLLRDVNDERLFDYYATSQLILVDTIDGSRRDLGAPGRYRRVHPSPDGTLFLVHTVQQPFSRLLPVGGFPTDIVVWDRTGQALQTVASLPSAAGVPIEGVLPGPRAVHWCPVEPATLFWIEALDGGDPRTEVPHRDRLMAWAAPFSGDATEVLRLEHRFRSLVWGEREALALISDYDRDRRWLQTFLIRADGSEPARQIWDRSIRDRYGDPGSPMMRTLPDGGRVLWQDGDHLYLAGDGASPDGDYPFLDRLDLQTLQTERLFQCEPESYERVVALIDDDEHGALRFLTQHETSDSPPNYRLRTVGSTDFTALTDFPDPAPELRKITKQRVTYNRADGTPLSFTMYLPPDYDGGQRLPTLVWAYPREYNDPATAGQVSGSTHRFTLPTGASHLFLALMGYAVLDNATMPIVGPPESMNDTFVQQIVDSAQAAIDKAAELGVTDPQRVGVGGHSYGAFMTANLLAHSDLFRAGIARSGAYNRSLTPFGFQGERRTLWEAPETYAQISPLMHADKIRAPILLIHGEVDNNSGTYPMQSERLFQAIKGNGGNVRYVTLPYESHGYVARESIEHTLFEMIAWFDQHVTQALPTPEDPTPDP
ncbi:MAG: S9 family peptidase [Planctomycetaceae bacterium]|nr:MAG: S9 family peptidase [Planctomycetaceae bacterium]